MINLELRPLRNLISVSHVAPWYDRKTFPFMLHLEHQFPVPWSPLCSESFPSGVGSGCLSSGGGVTGGRTRTLPANKKPETGIWANHTEAVSCKWAMRADDSRIISNWSLSTRLSLESVTVWIKPGAEEALNHWPVGAANITHCVEHYCCVFHTV